MARVAIKRVKSYSDPALRKAVSAILSMDPDLVEWLGEGVPDRLVVVKPNWIQASHAQKDDVWEPLITHPSVVLAIVEKLAGLMCGRGTICICDAPNTFAEFDRITARGKLPEALERVRSRYPELGLDVIDLRREIWVVKEDIIVKRVKNKPDPRGYASINLGTGSMLHGFRGEGRYYGADYDSDVVNRHHHGETHEYLLAGTPLKCDLLVNVAKLKTHKKTGITCCLKNLVGINGDKNWLPHYTKGTPKTGGDEFCEDRHFWRMESSIKKIAQRAALAMPKAGTLFYRKARNVGIGMLGDSEESVRNGNWYGNDTCWRMALDLNRVLLYGNPDGSLREAPQAKRYLAIVDGIVGGQGNGPLSPDPVQSCVLFGGRNPAVVDAVASRLMGFEPTAFPIVREAFSDHSLPIADVPLHEIVVDDDRVGATVGIADVCPAVEGGFISHFAWQGAVKRVSEQQE